MSRERLEIFPHQGLDIHEFFVPAYDGAEEEHALVSDGRWFALIVNEPPMKSL